MTLDAATRQRLLELAYETISEAEAAELRQRIASDPEVSAAFAEAQRQAGILASAARLSVEPMAWKPPDAPVPPPKPVPPMLANGPRSNWRLAHWLVGLAAALLAIVSLAGYGYHRQQLAQLASQQLRLFVAGPPRLEGGAPAQFTVVSTGVTGEPVPAQIELTIVTPDERPLWREKDWADKQGRLRSIIPANLTIPRGSRLLVSASHDSRVERIAAPLNVSEPQYRTHLVLDRVQFESGETVYARSVSLSRFAMKADRELGVRFELHDAKGAAVGASVEGLTQHGVGNAALKLPATAPPGDYAVVARSLDRSFAEVRQTLVVGRRSAVEDGKPNGGESAEPPVAAGETIVRFFPEGGELAADLENRVYFTARTAAGQAVKLSGRIVDSAGTEVALVETQRDGMGAFYLRPRPDRQYRLKILEPAGIAALPKLPPVVTEQKIVLSAGTGVFAAGRPLEFNVRAAADGLPLVAAVACWGVVVAQQPLVTSAEAGGANPMEISLPDEIAGVLRLTLFDYSQSPPEPIAERLVYRRPKQQISLRAERLIEPNTANPTSRADESSASASLKDAYQPGERIELSLSARDEQQRPVAAVLGARVAIAEADGGVSLPAGMLLLGSISHPSDLENADFYLAETDEASAALDLLLGTHGWRRFVTGAVADARIGRANAAPADAPLVFDNLIEIRDEYQSSLNAYRIQRSRWLTTLTTLCFFGGLALLLAVAILGLLRVVAGAHLWVSAVGAMLCCAIIGAALVDGHAARGSGDIAVAFAPHRAAAEPSAPQEKNAADDQLGRIEMAKANKGFRRGTGTVESDGDARQLAVDERAEKAVPRAAAGAAPARKVDALADANRSVGRSDARRLSSPSAPPAEVQPRAQRPFEIREYAFEPSDSIDAARTLLWRPLIVLDDKGAAKLAFSLPKVEGRYLIAIDAHGDGRLGSLRAEFRVAPVPKP
jgi:hypothetical protein